MTETDGTHTVICVRLLLPRSYVQSLPSVSDKVRSASDSMGERIRRNCSTIAPQGSLRTKQTVPVVYLLCLKSEALYRDDG